MFKTKGGGVNGFLNNVKKTTDLGDDATPYDDDNDANDDDYKVSLKTMRWSYSSLSEIIVSDQ